MLVDKAKMQKASNKTPLKLPVLNFGLLPRFDSAGYHKALCAPPEENARLIGSFILR
jgi:hypothetical protein